jgi:hypothetical protein
MGDKLNQGVEKEKLELDKVNEELSSMLHNHINVTFSNPISMITFCWALARGRFEIFSKTVTRLAKELLGLYTKKGGDIDK